MNKKIILLVGFSTTGKSSIKTRCNLQDVALIDTDKLVSKVYNKDNPHIYNIYCEMSDNETGDRSRAIKFIEREESKIANTLSDISENELNDKLIFSCGPFIVTRLGFSSSLNELRKSNDVNVIHLKKDLDSVCEDLANRHDRFPEEIKKHKNFACWDQDVITKYDNNSKRWVRDEENSIKNIEAIMSGVSPFYTEIADNEFYFNEDEKICGHIEKFFMD